MYDGKERKEEGKERKEQRVTSKSLKPHIPFSFLIHAPEAQFPLVTPSPTHSGRLDCWYWLSFLVRMNGLKY